MQAIHYELLSLTGVALVALVVAIVCRWRWYRPVVYRYSLASFLASTIGRFSSYRRVLLYGMRVCALVLLALVIGKPQVPDRRVTVEVEGIDIVLVIDVSGSMACFDDAHDRRSRLEVAKHEAIRFVEQRDHDALGLVVFANGTMTACPLTHDHVVLREIIQQLAIGNMLDDRCTLLSYGMLAALNRLKQSSSPSRVMIVLTDGQPSMHDAPVHVPLEIAKQLGVKIYTIGVGSEQGGFCKGPGGMLIASGVQLNEPLLSYLAQQTGGVFYRARSAAQMRSIYQSIDQLEKRPEPVNLYAHFVAVFEPIVWMVLMLLIAELSLVVLWKML